MAKVFHYASGLNSERGLPVIRCGDRSMFFDLFAGPAQDKILQVTVRKDKSEDRVAIAVGKREGNVNTMPEVVLEFTLDELLKLLKDKKANKERNEAERAALALNAEFEAEGAHLITF